jgi:hypothetical protein
MCKKSKDCWATVVHNVDILSEFYTSSHPKTLYKKTVQENVDDDILNKLCFSRAHTVERRE